MQCLAKYVYRNMLQRLDNQMHSGIKKYSKLSFKSYSSILKTLAVDKYLLRFKRSLGMMLFYFILKVFQKKFSQPKLRNNIKRQWN